MIDLVIWRADAAVTIRAHGPPVLVRALILVLAIGAGAVPVRAQERPLTIIAPAAPGGGWDQTARAMQRALLALAAARHRPGGERAWCGRHHRPGALRHRRARPA